MNVDRLVTKMVDKDRLRDMAAGVVDDIPRINGFRLPLQTLEDVQNLCDKLAENIQLKAQLVSIHGMTE
jgi:hypothetical protein